MALEAGFKDVRSVELDMSLAAAAGARFKGNPAVKTWQGSSTEVLDGMLADVATGATFWLDAHPCVPHLNFSICPLMEELVAVKRFAERVVPNGHRVFVLADDMDTFSDVDVKRIEAAMMAIPGVRSLSRERSYRGPFIMVAT